MNIPNQTICLGDTRTDIVKQIQNKLNQKNPYPVEVDGIFGYLTKHAVMTFQNNYCDLYGQPLQVDGVVGAKTWGALFGHAMKQTFEDSPFARETIRIALDELGVKEDPPGSNNGPRIKEYLRCVGLPVGNAWCAAFVYWSAEQAAAHQNRMNPLIKTASCLTHWHLNRVGEKLNASRAIAHPELIQPGSIFILDRGKGKGHTGLVTGILENQLFTIEGNTNQMHSAEGEGVYQLQRQVSSVNLGYLFYN
jgi:hypothetical protein